MRSGPGHSSRRASHTAIDTPGPAARRTQATRNGTASATQDPAARTSGRTYPGPHCARTVSADVGGN
jgi:hypothetical protein